MSQDKNLIHSVTTKRKYRFISALLNNDPSTAELRGVVGCSNPSDMVRSFKRQGWKIYADRRNIKDRDGVTVKPAWYSLDESQIEIAKQALEHFRTRQGQKV
ncbi:hypothetical protein [Thiomicrospira cyclica]|uniref:Helix-turn-helix domain-containing protein n=1 Tax=Thiomicrospira cyclica (strain DSM 14477 / JCM 11371 / ALM1) TaxID=717773 RepID=F6DCF5_THICA|nr:hypothetical protein [Thiomicrospira cyclica]AEG31541.1 hypothetical protein Thicy_0769 [Thiomicrospira cyclica ALM1]